uniref:Uncharacterized protein n=1 Tax=Neogobius melanostomus TaxID=47308 RepID=A0A8C6TDN6_9GOBI
MRLCVSAVLLLLLALTRAAPGPGSEECSKFSILKDKTQMLGHSHMLAAFTDNVFSRNILGAISSLWSRINETQTGLNVAQFSKMNGTCKESRFNMTTSGDTAKVVMFGMKSECQLLNFSSTSMIMDFRATTNNIATFIEKFHLDPNINHGPSDTSQILKAHDLFLISKEPDLNEMDLQRFRAHAKCKGFTGEPDFLRNSREEYCTEEESAPIH